MCSLRIILCVQQEIFYVFNKKSSMCSTRDLLRVQQEQQFDHLRVQSPESATTQGLAVMIYVRRLHLSTLC